jgi:hypothetical protein
MGRIILENKAAFLNLWGVVKLKGGREHIEKKKKTTISILNPPPPGGTAILPEYIHYYG